MGKAKDLSVEQKATVTALLKNTELSQRQIAIKSGVSQTSVNRLRQKLCSREPIEAARIGRCGRKSLVTSRGKRILRNIVMEHRRATNSVIKQKFEKAGCSVSTRTVLRNLYDLGFKCRRPVKKPRLTPAMVKKRLEWAYAHKHLTVEDWRIVS